MCKLGLSEEVARPPRGPVLEVSGIGSKSQILSQIFPFYYQVK